MDDKGLAVLLILIACLNLYATVRMSRAKQYTTIQKWLQLALIWVLPIFGAVIVILLMQPPKDPPKDDGFPKDPGINEYVWQSGSWGD